ncbi:hypothetical protein AAH446_05920 [Erwinia sp. P6884]|uniref:hypothetical protein n=1 Tax=Erwinia sp. P6884 TaxID=3141450 RepID=UPI00319B3AD6
MKIACLGWGSLIWKPEALPLESEWHPDGPMMPVEFSRIGDGGELATAICMGAPLVQACWAILATESIELAVAALREREGIPAKREDGVGMLMAQRRSHSKLAEWASEREIDALIWTALPPRFAGVEGLIPSSEDALEYLRSLEGEKRAHAFDYIRQVPAQLDTPYRRAFHQHLDLHA